ncbi:MAG: hypothetical protein GC191_21140 [Azospirillum sp.]|nr:hypothetical protein [Azospirillum sp.]
MNEAAPAYYRRDREGGITPPNLLKDCTIAEHIVRARGKRTKFTSVSLDLSKLRDFGDASYRLKKDLVLIEGHSVIEHEALIAELRQLCENEIRADRARALQALRYARKRLEGLIDWRFDVGAVERKQLDQWVGVRVQRYFQRI